MTELTDLALGLGKEVLAEVKASLGEDYASLTDEQKQSIEDTAAKLLELQLRSKSGEDVEAQLQAVVSTIQDWKVWGEFATESAFWKGVQKVASALGSFLGGLAGPIITDHIRNDRI